MFGTTESVIDSLKDLVNKLESGEIQVLNASTEGSIWVDKECVRFGISLTFLSSNMYKDDEDDEEEEFDYEAESDHG